MQGNDPRPLESFVAELVAMKHRAGRLRLWSTMQALDVATTIVGWELAEMMKRQTERDANEGDG